MFRSGRSVKSPVKSIVAATSVHSMLVATLAFISYASPAQAQAQGAPPGGPLMQLIPFVVIFGVMYFFMIRPQMRRQKEHQAVLAQLKRGDEVLTSGGILGRIEGLTDQFVTLEIAPDVRIKVLRSQIAGLATNVASASKEVKA